MAVEVRKKGNNHHLNIEQLGVYVQSGPQLSVEYTRMQSWTYKAVLVASDNSEQAQWAILHPVCFSALGCC